METKTCTKCKKDLFLDCFAADKHLKIGLRSACRECTAIVTKHWKEKNKEHCKNYNREYTKTENGKRNVEKYKMSEKRKLYDYRYRRTDIYRKKQLERRKIWGMKNKEKVNAYNRIHEKMRYNYINIADDKTINQESLKKLLEYQNYRCGLCGKNLKKYRKHHDHIVPLSKGGKHSIFNSQWLCQSCNVRKSAKMPSGQLSIFNI